MAYTLVANSTCITAGNRPIQLHCRHGIHCHTWLSKLSLPVAVPAPVVRVSRTLLVVDPSFTTVTLAKQSDSLTLSADEPNSIMTTAVGQEICRCVSVMVLPCPDEENKTSFEMFYEHCFRCEVKDPHYHEFHALANQLTYTCIHIGAFQHLVTHISQLACRCKT